MWAEGRRNLCLAGDSSEATAVVQAWRKHLFREACPEGGGETVGVLPARSPHAILGADSLCRETGHLFKLFVSMALIFIGISRIPKPRMLAGRLEESCSWRLGGINSSRVPHA